MKASQMQECTFNITAFLSFCRRSGYDHYIFTAWEQFFIQTIAFTYQPCQSVPDNTVANLLADGDPQSVFFKTIICYIHDQIPVGIGSSVFVDMLKISVLFQ